MRIRILIFLLVAFAGIKAKAQKYPFTMEAVAGLLVGNGVLPVFSGQVFSGIRIDKYSAEGGLSIGVDAYKQFTLLPISADIKWLPFHWKSVRPYVSLNAGYGLTWLQSKTDEITYKGGTVFNPSLGIRIKTKRKLKWSIAAGLKQQKATIYEKNEDGLGNPVRITTQEFKFSRLSLTLGAGFD